MKKQLLVFLLAMLSCYLQAQNYDLIRHNGENHFLGKNNEIFTIRIDTVFPASGATYYKNYKSFFTDYNTPPTPCVAILADSSWIGDKIVLDTANGERNYYFYSREHPQLGTYQMTIKPLATLNDTWLFSLLPNADYIEATLSNISFQNILGIIDSVKTITLQAKNSTNANIPHPFNGQEIKFSENYGLVKIFDVFNFPLDTISYNLVGASNPDRGVVNLTAREIYDYNIGDEFHTITNSQSVPWSYVYTTRKKTILAKNISQNQDTITYTYEQCQTTISYPQNDTTHSFDTVLETIVLSELEHLNKLNYELLPNNFGHARFLPNNTFAVPKRQKDIVELYHYNSSSDCWEPIVGNTYVSYYLDGLGGGYHENNSIPLVSDYHRLVYYKKGTEVWGTPIQAACPSLAVIGQVVVDANTNCLADSLEQGLSGQLVKFERQSDGAISYFTTYNSLGNYRASLDTGTYTITATPSGPYWQVCPNSQQVTIDTNYNIQIINWALQPTVFCPFLEVDIAAPFLRMTGGGSYYTVSYCNNGTVAANNAYIEVDLDDDLNFISATIPVASQSGTVYTFNLGNIVVGQCGDFQINVIVDTSALFEQTHCTEAHIYPDSVCVPIWSDAIVDGDVGCQNDTVFFYIENLGAAMLLPQPYSIIEDNIAMRTGTIQLGAGQSTTIAQAATAGKTYRIEVQQLPGFPALLGDSSFTAAIEDCNPLPNGSFNTGFITQFSNGHSSPFIAVDCQQNVASYDPNDKSAQPEGYGLAHYIERGTPIDYKVRFQNTGTDTAFNIVIVDTLSPYLDIASLTMGASSHDYTWMIEDGNVLKVSFLNIMLVDSNANEPLSHGFFRYRIEQKANNPIGAVINNQAAIYFDYNPAILTNTTFHTVGENFVPIILSIDETYEEQVIITAFPNPFTNSTTIKVEGKEYSELQLSIFDITGKSVAQEQGYSNNQIELTRGNLQPGIYIYQLQGDGKLIGVGKIVVQ